MNEVTSPHATDAKSEVRDFWEKQSCGEVYATGANVRERFEAQERERYGLEPFILEFMQPESGRDRDVLEIGVGLGADHLNWARSGPRRLVGIDLTARAIANTKSRFESYGLTSELKVADAEHLPFPDASFDVVYSWGVLHHSPDTAAAVREVHRVLRNGGLARVMIYSKHSLVGYLLWLRYALLRGRPFLSLRVIYDQFLESKGTKAYDRAEARLLFSQFSKVTLGSELSPGDLLIGAAGQRHSGLWLKLARRVWPRFVIRKVARRLGLFLTIIAIK